MASYKKPDVKAPRFRIDSPGILDEKFYKAFKKKYPQYQKYSNKELGDIISMFNGKLWQEVIDNRDGIELPESLGYIFVGTCPSPIVRKNSDFGESNKTLVHTRIKNYETNGYLAKIFYSNYSSKYVFMFREIWEFKGARQFTRAVSAAYRKDWKKYIVVENDRLISKLYKKVKAIQWSIENSKIIPENYNEFEFD